MENKTTTTKTSIIVATVAILATAIIGLGMIGPASALTHFHNHGGGFIHHGDHFFHHNGGGFFHGNHGWGICSSPWTSFWEKQNFGCFGDGLDFF